MNDQDYARKAIALADGWSITIDDDGEMTSFYAPMWLPQATVKELSTSGVRLDKLSQQMLDALAAQLVRQVDALRNPSVGVITSELGSIHIWRESKLLTESTQLGRTMNTIKAIVDSKVLK